MANTLLSLPVDVPWKRIAISTDMYAKSLDAFPDQWASSIAVYLYEPPPDPLDTTGEITTFLKVTASITGINWQGARFDLGGGVFTWPHFFWYPALSALIQVAVVPKGTQQDGTPWDIGQFPYFSDFEPKKREVIQSGSVSGESMTTSTPDLTVNKSTTSTPSMETDLSGTHSGDGSTSGAVTKVFGQASSNTTEITNASQQIRATTSFTTNLSHVFQILDTYHTGTNRAMFLVSARPDLVDSLYTFAKGPRRLEGIQDFFLVVRRPKEMTGICVKAILETAHLAIDDPTSKEVFITSREVAGCSVGGVLQIGTSGPLVTHESSLNKTIGDLLAAANKAGKGAVVAANALGRALRDEMVKSLGSPDRSSATKVDIAQTQFGIRQIIGAIPTAVLQQNAKLRQAVSKMKASVSAQPSMQKTIQELPARTEFLRTVGYPLTNVNITNKSSSSKQTAPPAPTTKNKPIG